MCHSTSVLSALGSTKGRVFPGGDKPMWALPLYQQPSRPTQAAIDAYRSAIAAERRLSVPHGISLLQQAETVSCDYLVFCDGCDQPIDPTTEHSCPGFTL